MEKQWVFEEEPEASTVGVLADAINVNSVLATLLVQRGISTYQEAHDFFRPSLDHLHDPFLMKDMDLAVERLNQAMAKEEKILVYGDYDVDGTTSVSLVYGFLAQHYPHVEFYIPDRYKEGYGVSTTAIDWAEENNIGLIISLDCGIKAVDLIGEAKDRGIDFIICDHHRPGPVLPPAVAVLDPKREDCQYPYQELSGCGVGFKFMQAWCLHSSISERKLYPFLDLVAVSVAADIVPITGENRVLAHFGLKVVNQKPRPGLAALIEVGSIKGEVTINSIVFGIGPRINASGRVSHAKASVELLLSGSLEEAREFAKNVDANNTARRQFDTTITEEAIKMIETNDTQASKTSTVLYKETWHKGVIGIVASRCMDQFYRPTIILTESEGKVTGSARSVEGFDIYDAIAECSDLLDQFGGHSYAAGLTLSLDNVEAFSRRFEAVVAERIRPEQLIPQIHVDTSMDLERITEKFYGVLRQMAPFGPNNMPPVFVTKRVYVFGRPRVLKEAHLKLKVKQEGSEAVVEAIGFGMAEYYDLVASGMRFSMAYTVEENNYMGNKYLQLYLKDIQFD